MDRNAAIHKIIFSVLNTLLIMGALVGVMTIDRGRWILSNPAFYQAAEEEVGHAVTTAKAAGDDQTMIIPITGADCLTASQRASAERYTTYMLVNGYLTASGAAAAQRVTAVAMTTCDELTELE
jgi:hypothetical protein